jgi:glucose-1-phosphate cytidylyltransferase
MLEIGGVPVLRHVMDIYAHQGVTDFVLATGYRHEVIDSYAAGLPDDWDVDAVNTGDDAGTGDRLLACLDRMGEEFCLTYGDGLGDVDIAALLARHHDHSGTATVTVVPLRSQYGTLDLTDDDQVSEFREKPVLADHLINAGFFALNTAAFDNLIGRSLERDLLPELSRRRQLFAYRHVGFWRSMDTHKDITELNRLATREGTPWLPRPSSPESASSSPAHRGSSAHT